MFIFFCIFFSLCKNFVPIFLYRPLVKWRLMHVGNLRTVLIPASATEIQEYAFNSCDSLETVYYTGTSEQWNAI